ncbi:unnamed protein product [Cyprideis torosa]|uniref:Uncharacterized protein n=1 Tax=Cyprideis torosa TaxID=163714 RepID=A0A7R8ZM59_9CRUS|nr:unnamed protein product [Cyprideis torosa]CAG0894806.1 unnamed protein product [Cyprideis torosa]
MFLQVTTETSWADVSSTETSSADPELMHSLVIPDGDVHSSKQGESSSRGEGEYVTEEGSETDPGGGNEGAAREEGGGATVGRTLRGGETKAAGERETTDGARSQTTPPRGTCQGTSRFPCFTCPYCKRTYTKRSAYDTHVRYDCLPPTIPCDLCSKLFKRPADFRRHRATVHRMFPDRKSPLKPSATVKKRVDQIRAQNPESMLIKDELVTESLSDDLTWFASTSSKTMANQNHSSNAVSTDDIMHCPKCGKAYFGRNAKAKFRMHVNYDCGPPKYKCSFCQRRFKRPVDMRNHSLIIHGVDVTRYPLNVVDQAVAVPQCPKCCRIFSGSNVKAKLWTHVKYDCGPPRFSCSYCERLFKRPGDRNRHIYNIHWQYCKPASPNFSSVPCATVPSLARMPQRNIECTSTTTVDRLVSLAMSVGNFSNAPPMSDPICCSSISTFRCPHCGREYRGPKALNSLRNHMKYDCGPPTNTCVYCKRSFNRKYHLERHVMTVHADIIVKEARLHHGVRRQVGPTTPLKNYALMIVPHSAEEYGCTFRCPHCAKEYTGPAASASLRTHMLYDCGPPTNACSYCHRSFNRRYQLKRHMLTVHADILMNEARFLQHE